MNNRIKIEGTIYIADMSGDVSVIDIKTNTVKAKINTGGSIFDIAVSPDGRLIYVAPLEYFDVSVIETKTNTVVDTINLAKDSLFGTTSSGIAFTPDGQLAYVLHDDNKVSIIDVSTNKIVKTVNINESTTGIAITPEGKFAYIAGAQHVFLLDIQTNTLVKMIEQTMGGADRVRIAFSPEGKFAYIADFTTGKIFVIDVTTNTMKPVNIESHASDVTITPDGKFAYAVGDKNLCVIDTATNVVVKTVELGENLIGVAITMDGKFSYIGDMNTDVIYIVQTSSNTLAGTINLGVPVGGLKTIKFA
ncbi:MAG: cytochrome D1 domain-containing protein [Bacillota bacterium]